MLPRTIPSLVFVALASFALSSLPADAAAPRLKNGVFCEKEPENAFEGETHRCFFSPQRHGSRDFSTRNGRAQYVFTVLGEKCDEIEILGDGKAELPAGDPELRQVSVSCTD